MFKSNYINAIRIDEESDLGYVNNIRPIKNINRLNFDEKVTMFVGENGTGKSTLLEAIAIAYGFNPEGGSLNYSFSTRDSHANLSSHLTLEKYLKAKDGFFLRAESFYNLSSYIDDNIYENALPSERKEYGGKLLHEQSHGESCINTVINRFRGNGIYILDEPESALSPQRQLTLISKIMELSSKGSQFIIATHSPILLGIKGACIYSFDDEKIEKIAYEETESYKITKLFIENRETILRNLL